LQPDVAPSPRAVVSGPDGLSRFEELRLDAQYLSGPCLTWIKCKNPGRYRGATTAERELEPVNGIIIRPNSAVALGRTPSDSSRLAGAGLSDLSWHRAGAVACTGARDGAMSRVQVLSGPGTTPAYRRTMNLPGAMHRRTSQRMAGEGCVRLRQKRSGGQGREPTFYVGPTRAPERAEEVRRVPTDEQSDWKRQR
jgi:hypothetical protein